MTYAGQSLKRFEDHRLLTGQGSYVDDLKLPGMLHAAVLRSPHAHARVISIDATAALSLPGVVSVVTAPDLAEGLPNVPTRSSTDADELSPPEHPTLAADKVCYVGQAVAIVLAQDPYLARDALDLVQVDYAPCPVLLTRWKPWPMARRWCIRSWVPTWGCAR